MPCNNEEWQDSYVDFYNIAMKTFTESSAQKRKEFRNKPGTFAQETIERAVDADLLFDGGDDIDYMKKDYCHRNTDKSLSKQFLAVIDGKEEIEVEAANLFSDGLSKL